jgi:hypothetical protein
MLVAVGPQRVNHALHFDAYNVVFQLPFPCLTGVLSLPIAASPIFLAGLGLSLSLVFLTGFDLSFPLTSLLSLSIAGCPPELLRCALRGGLNEAYFL